MKHRHELHEKILEHTQLRQEILKTKRQLQEDHDYEYAEAMR